MIWCKAVVGFLRYFTEFHCYIELYFVFYDKKKYGFDNAAQNGWIERINSKSVQPVAENA